MKHVICFLAALVVLWLHPAARASDPIGIYALVDKVVLEPSEASPQRVQIWGAFATAAAKFGDEYLPPVRGYLYYKLPSEKADLAVREWNDLKRLAGTGQVVSFGARWMPSGRVRSGPGPEGIGGQIDAQRIAKAIAQLDDRQQLLRERASDELQELGKAAEPALAAALQNQPSAEAATRLKKLQARLEPDVYPLGVGVNKFRRDESFEPARSLRSIPAPQFPADGEVVPAGKVTLRTQNVADQKLNFAYHFEIENEFGNTEASPATQAGNQQTQWTPAKLQLKPGERYTWRVWVETDGYKGPVASASFRAK